MIRLATCTNEFNANLLKGALESEGIPAMLSNEIMCGYMGTQGVDVLVKEEDLEAAKKILEQQEKNKKRPPSIWHILRCYQHRTSPSREGL